MKFLRTEFELYQFSRIDVRVVYGCGCGVVSCTAARSGAYCAVQRAVWALASSFASTSMATVDWRPLEAWRENV